MKKFDIFNRAYKNIKNNKFQSFKIILLIFISTIILSSTVALFIASKDYLKEVSNLDDLTTIKVNNIEARKTDGIVEAITSKRLGAWSLEEAKKVLNDFDKSLGNIYIRHILDPDLSIGEFENYIFRTCSIAIDYDQLKNINIYSGEKIKDINGAIINRKFLEKAITKNDFKNNIYNNLKTVDIIGKTLEFPMYYNIYENDKIIKKEVKIPIRIDGVIDDKDEIYSENEKLFDDNYSMNKFNYSYIFLPIERVEMIYKELGLDTDFDRLEVVIKANNIEKMNMIISDLNKTKYGNFSIYKKYVTFKYINFILKIVCIILSICILVSVIIGVSNMMTLSITSRNEEIKILKLLGIKNKDLKLIYLLESVLLSLIGSLSGIIFIFFLAKQINDKFELNYLLFTNELLIFNVLFNIIICFFINFICLSYLSKTKFI